MNSALNTTPQTETDAAVITTSSKKGVRTKKGMVQTVNLTMKTGTDHSHVTNHNSHIVLHLAACFLTDLKTHPKTPSLFADATSAPISSHPPSQLENDNNQLQKSKIKPMNALAVGLGAVGKRANKYTSSLNTGINNTTAGSSSSSNFLSPQQTVGENTADDMTNIWKKIKMLQMSIQNNTIYNPMSPCFWCTCQFTSPPIYIPKCKHTKHILQTNSENDTSSNVHHSNKTMTVQVNSGQIGYDAYGHFCTPECATAYLHREHLDSATKIARYQMLCGVYSEAYADNEWINFKAAPDPHYILSKYLGTLSDEEFQTLIQNRRVFISVAVPPLTRIIPELHENSDLNICGVANQLIPEWCNKNVVDGCVQSDKTAALKRFGLLKQTE